uniref:IS91 family transposase n=1 Tax=Xanthobacter flavus TaxID=281 RepID=UPI00372D1413
MADDGRWIACRPNFFLPIHVLSRLFRRRFIERLVQAHDEGELSFFGELAALNAPEAFAGMGTEQRRINWIVYTKPPFGSPQHILTYLGRYTHRVAIANSRLVSLDDDAVAFRWRDYRHGNAVRVMTIHPSELIRRFLLHTLPDGFHRIRHFGFLANGHRRSRLVLVRQAIAVTASKRTNDHDAGFQEAARPSRLAFDPALCPCCGGAMRVIAILPRCRPCPDTS